MAKTKQPTDVVLEELRDYGLGYPGAHLKSPWPGHLDLAVKDKTFAYLSIEGEPFSIGCKLPRSNGVALMLPFCKPTAYGLGKSGWISASPSPSEINVDMFKSWIDESYRAQAPKKLAAQIGTTAPQPAKAKVAAKLKPKAAAKLKPKAAAKSKPKPKPAKSKPKPAK
ncbi:MAG: MmcQ/YjbR family DNA-binding protein [Deltaproteobacteria bacterium]|nr:MmcQ/YjbR family DNA-binding protein [Deltaproteobacteria bacterium]